MTLLPARTIDPPFEAKSIPPPRSDAALPVMVQSLRVVVSDEPTWSAPPARVGVRKKMTYIRFSESAEHSIADSVHQDIRIGMTFQAFRVGNLYAS